MAIPITVTLRRPADLDQAAAACGYQPKDVLGVDNPEAPEVFLQKHLITYLKEKCCQAVKYPTRAEYLALEKTAMDRALARFDII